MRKLNYIIELVKAGSIRQAAENLNITHSALVHAVKSIEDYYGIKLFDRGRGFKAKLTREGEVFVKGATQVVHHHNDLTHNLELLSEAGIAKLSIAFGPYPYVISGQWAVCHLASLFPRLKIKVAVRHYKDVSTLVSNRIIDIGIADMHDLTMHKEMDLIPLDKHIVCYFCRPSHPLLKKKNIEISDVVQFPWCSTRVPARVTDYLPGDLSMAGEIDPITMEMVPAIELESMSGINRLIVNSDIICIATLTMFKYELQRGEVVVLPFRQDWMKSNYGIMTLKSRTKSPAADVFINEIYRIEKEVLQEEQILASSYLKAANIKLVT